MAVSAKYYKEQINSESYRFPCGSAGNESARNAGDLGLNPGLGRFPWRKGKTTHSSILAERIPGTNGVSKSQTQLSNFHFSMPVCWQEKQMTWMEYWQVEKMQPFDTLS